MIAWIVPFFVGKRQGRGRFSSAPLRLSINLPAEGLGGKDSVKENRQGCLLRLVNRLFETSKGFKKSLSLSKRLFRQAERPRNRRVPGPFFL